jgi:hypothetical protein
MRKIEADDLGAELALERTDYHRITF